LSLCNWHELRYLLLSLQFWHQPLLRKQLVVLLCTASDYIQIFPIYVILVIKFFVLFSTNFIVSSSVEDIFSEKRKSCRITVTFLCYVVLENKWIYILFCCTLTFVRLKRIVYKIISFLYQACTNLRRQCTRATKICTVALNVFGPTVWNFVHITHLAPRILSWLLNFGKFTNPLCLFNTGPTPF
jgi:hypothetical protein